MNKEQIKEMLEEIKNMDLRARRDSIWDSDEITGSEARNRIIKIIDKYAINA